MVFKDMCRSTMIAAMGEYLLPYIHIIDFRQGRKIDIIGSKVRS